MTAAIGSSSQQLPPPSAVVNDASDDSKLECNMTEDERGSVAGML